MDKPLVSICSITYNHAPYIRQCLDGFLMQKTNFPFEIIINDDCSTDGTTEIIKEYAAKYPDLIKPIFHDENQYQKGVRGMFLNFVFPKAQGQYLALCEGDDYWIDPLKLQKQVDFLETHSDYSMSYTDNFLFKQSKRECQHDRLEGKRFELGNKLTCEDIIRYPRIILTLSVLIKKSVYEKAKLSDPFIFEADNFLLGDIPLWYTAAKIGKVHYLPERTSVYRILDNSASHIKGFRNRYKFSVSAQGLRAYLCRRDNLSSDLSNLIERRYANVFLHHLVLNPDYKPVVPLLPNTHRFELFLQRYKLLGTYLVIKDICRKLKLTKPL